MYHYSLISRISLFKNWKIWSMLLKEQFALALQPVNGREATFKRIGAIFWRNKDDGGIDDQMTTVTII
jgi:hypothetical protein